MCLRLIRLYIHLYIHPLLTLDAPSSCLSLSFKKHWIFRSFDHSDWLTHSFIQFFVRLACSFVHSIIHSLIHSSIYSFTHSFISSFIRLFIHSINESFIHAFILFSFFLSFFHLSILSFSSIYLLLSFLKTKFKMTLATSPLKMILYIIYWLGIYVYSMNDITPSLTDVCM